MNTPHDGFRLLLTGAGPRLLIAGAVVAVLWALFFAVTGLPWADTGASQ